MKRVLISQKLHDEALALLAARSDVRVEQLNDTSQSALLQAVREVDAMVVRGAVINRAVLAAAPRLRIVSRHGVGYDAVDTVACAERNIPVTITPAANAVSVAEHAMFMLLALAKSARAHDAATRAGHFAQARNAMTAVDLRGRHLLILGFGRIGAEVAPRALAFGMRVSAYDPYIAAERIKAAGCEVVTDLAEALPTVDALTVHTPFTPETEGCIGAAQIRAMRPGCLIINTARGGIVDEGALHAALSAGHVGGAGLDVFVGEPSPPPSDHPLFAFDNVLVSPHSAGVTQEAMVRMGCHSVQHVLDFFDGHLDPQVVVNDVEV